MLYLIPDGKLLHLELKRGGVASFEEYPFSIPAVRSLDRLGIGPGVTFFVGENGAGKSTLLEGLAIALGANPEGGGTGFRFSTRRSHSVLHQHLRVARSGRLREVFFLRAESTFNLASEIERLDSEPGFGPAVINSYGGVSLHAQSHGESFLAIAKHRLGRGGVYLFDEPESALSPTRQLALLALMTEWVQENQCQVIIATHSPILLAFPSARIYELSGNGISQVAYEDTFVYRTYRDFLSAPATFLRYLQRPTEPSD